MAPLLFAAAVGLPAVLVALLILRWRIADSRPTPASAPPADVAPPALVRLPTPAPRRAPAPSAPLHDRDLPPAAEWRAWLWTYAWDGATSPMLPALPATSDPSDAPASTMPDTPAPTEAAGAAPDPPAAPPPSMDERALAILTQVYREAIQVSYDTSLPALCVSFTACPVRTPDEVALAFSTLNTKARLLLGGEAGRGALLLDESGLEIGPAVQAEWDAAFETFLARVCAEGQPGAYLLARFSSPSAALAATLPRLPTPALVRAALGASADINLSPAAVFRSRDEAVRYLTDLRRRSHLKD
jgi:hypothetical protein